MRVETPSWSRTHRSGPGILRALDRVGERWDPAGVVRKRRLPPPAASQVYELTDWGRELEPVLGALGGWGARAPLDPGAWA